MKYQKKYPLADPKQGEILLIWERGYKNVEIYHKDRLVTTIANPSEIKKGFVFYDKELNEIALSFSGKPLFINVIVNGFHSPINDLHPKNTFKAVSGIFWVIFTLNLFLLVIKAFALSEILSIVLPYLLIELLFSVVYVIAAIFTAKGKIWAYYLGYGYFVLLALVSDYLERNRYDFLDYMGFIFQVIIISILFKYIKTVAQLKKHNLIAPKTNDELLDI